MKGDTKVRAGDAARTDVILLIHNIKRPVETDEWLESSLQNE